MRDDTERPEGEDEEPKITVRDRRRVTFEGEVREVEEHDAPTPTPAPTPPPAEAAAEGEAAPRQRPSAKEFDPSGASQGQPRPRGGGLGGAESARVNRERPLREVPSEVEEPEEGEEGEAPTLRNVYDYVQAVASEMTIWCLSGLGLMQNPITRIVATDLDQARFSVDVADVLLRTLGESGKTELETQVGLYYQFVIQFGSVAAQLLRQPPQVRLQEIQKIRFCIDAADRFADRLAEVGEDLDPSVISDVRRTVQQLRLEFVQAAGGGDIIG